MNFTMEHLIIKPFKSCTRAFDLRKSIVCMEDTAHLNKVFILQDQLILRKCSRMEMLYSNANCQTKLLF